MWASTLRNQNRRRRSRDYLPFPGAWTGVGEAEGASTSRRKAGVDGSVVASISRNHNSDMQADLLTPWPPRERVVSPSEETTLDDGSSPELRQGIQWKATEKKQKKILWRKEEDSDAGTDAHAPAVRRIQSQISFLSLFSLNSTKIRKKG